MDPRILADEELVDDLIVFARYLHPDAGLLKKGPCKYKVHDRCVCLLVKQEEGCLPELFVADGPLEQPLADYIKDSGKKEIWNQNPAYQTALHYVPFEARISFEEVYPETRWEAMGVAVQEAEAREEHAKNVKTSSTQPASSSSATPTPRGLSAALFSLPPPQGLEGFLPPPSLTGSFMMPSAPSQGPRHGNAGSHGLNEPRSESIGLQGEGPGMLLRSMTSSHSLGLSARSPTPPPLLSGAAASPATGYRNTTLSPGPGGRSATPSRFASGRATSPIPSYRTPTASPGLTYRSTLASPSLRAANLSPSALPAHARTWASPTPGTPVTPTTPGMSMRLVQQHGQQQTGTPRDGRSVSPALDARMIDAQHAEIQNAAKTGKRPYAVASPLIYHRNISPDRSDSIPPLLKRNSSERADVKDFSAPNGIGQTARLQRQNSKYSQRDSSPTLADLIPEPSRLQRQNSKYSQRDSSPALAELLPEPTRLQRQNSKYSQRDSSPTLVELHPQCQHGGFTPGAPPPVLHALSDVTGMSTPLAPPPVLHSTSDLSSRMRQLKTSMSSGGLQCMSPVMRQGTQNSSSANLAGAANLAVVRVPSPVVLGSYRSANTCESHADASADTRRSNGPRTSSPESFSTHSFVSNCRTPDKTAAGDAAGAASSTTTASTPAGRRRETMLNSSPLLQPRACTSGDSARLSVSPARTPLVELRHVRPGNSNTKIQFLPQSRDPAQEGISKRTGFRVQQPSNRTNAMEASPLAVPAVGSDVGLPGTPRQSGMSTPIPLAPGPPNHAAAVLAAAPFVTPSPATSVLSPTGFNTPAVTFPVWEQHGTHVLRAGQLRNAAASGASAIGRIVTHNPTRGRSPRNEVSTRHHTSPGLGPKVA